MSSSREDWLSTISRLRRGSPLMNKEDRMLDHLTDHKRNCQHRSHEGNGKAEFLTQRHWLLSPSSGRPVSGSPRIPQNRQHDNRGGSGKEYDWDADDIGVQARSLYRARYSAEPNEELG